MAELYRVGDTPAFEVDVFQVNGVSPVTPTGPVTITVTNRATGATLSGTPVTTITGNRVVVTLPANPYGNTVGDYRAAAQVQIDATPTLRTFIYDYSVLAATT